MDPGLLKILLLAVIQGITEFLPISSDGHLVLASAWLPGAASEDTAEVVIVLHMGTLLSILVFYWPRIWRLLGEDRRVIPAILVGTIPAVLFGLPMKMIDSLEVWLESPLLAALMLPVTGLAVLWAGRQPLKQGEYQQLSWGRALWIGVCQAAAILPGLSRSGSTIAAGIGVGLARPAAATFSFLLAIPALVGAGVLQSLKLILKDEPITTPATHLAAGVVVSFVVGLAALYWLTRWLERGWLQYFGWYCIALGIVALATVLR